LEGPVTIPAIWQRQRTLSTYTRCWTSLSRSKAIVFWRLRVWMCVVKRHLMIILR